MRRSLILITCLSTTFGLSACDNDAERGIVGAGAGAVVASATGGSTLTGAILGGAAGVFCDDAGVCK